MVRHFLGIVTLCASLHASAIQWHDGAVILRNQDVRVGQIARQSNDLILFRSSQHVTVYVAHEVAMFRYYDKAEHINRKFASFQSSGQGPRPFRFYESVVSGWISVLRDQKSFSERIREENGGDYRLYILYENKLYPIRKFRTIYNHLARHRAEGAATMKVHSPAEAIQTIIRLNQSRPDFSIAGSGDRTGGLAFH